jgi:hypothetical protein
VSRRAADIGQRATTKSPGYFAPFLRQGKQDDSGRAQDKKLRPTKIKATLKANSNSRAKGHD